MTGMLFPTGFALIYAVIHMMLPMNFAGGYEGISLGDAMNVALADFGADSYSALVTDSRFIYNAIDAPQKWIAANLPGAAATLILLLSVGAIWVLAFNISQILTFLVLPIHELKRVIAPISDSYIPKPVSPGQIIYLSALITLFFFFIYLRGFASLEVAASQNQTYAAVRTGTIGLHKQLVEQIDGRFFRSGTIEALELEMNQVVSSGSAIASSLHDLTNTAFDEMEANVDKFLDGYYRVAADWVRLGTTLTGSIDEYLQDEFTEVVVQTPAFERMNAQIQGALEDSEVLKARFADRQAEILRENELFDVSPDSQSVTVVRSASLTDFNVLSNAGLDTDIVERGGVSALSGLVAGKITAKLATKSGFKLATSVLTKIAGKSISGGIGAVIGGTVGSIVPGAGTAIGAFIGIGVGVSLDYGMLKWEERRNRPSFRSQILEVLCDSRIETLESLNAPQNKYPEHCKR
jgi:hypothetical protein